MSNKGNFSVSAFAKYSRTTKDTLLHYDRIGLLSPMLRGDNGYRYYHPGQMAMVNVIRTMQDMGLSLNEIKEMVHERDPGSSEATFRSQIGRIDQKIKSLINTKQLLSTLHQNVLAGLEIDEHSISFVEMNEKSLILGERNDYSNGKNDYDALNIFYAKTQERYPDMNLNYPVWGYFLPERIKRGDWKWPDHFYFYHPQGEEKRPASLYAVGYTRGGYGECGDLYEKMLKFIKKNNHELSGGVYEEYMLNEIFITNEKNYLIRLMMEVSKIK